MAAPTAARSRAVRRGPQSREAGAEGQGDVLADGALHEQALGAVAGDEADALADGVGGVGEADRGPSTSMAPEVGRVEPERAAKSSSWPWPSRATTARTSPLPSSKETSCEIAADAEGAEREARGAGGGGAGRFVGGAGALDAAAEHEIDDGFLGAGGDGDDADGLAVAEHGGAVAERGDLEQAVRDEDHRAAGGGLLADGVEDVLGEVGGEGGGHLVEEEDVGLDGEGAGEVEDAERGEGEVAGEIAEVEAGKAEDADPVAEGAGGGSGEAEVVGDAEVGDQRGLLVDRDEAGAAGVAGRAGGQGLVAEQDRAAVGADRAGQDLHEGGLAGAVGAHQRVDLAGEDGEAGAAQGGDGAIGLGDAGGVEEGGGGHGFAVAFGPDRRPGSGRRAPPTHPRDGRCPFRGGRRRERGSGLTSRQGPRACLPEPPSRCDA